MQKICDSDSFKTGWALVQHLTEQTKTWPTVEFCMICSLPNKCEVYTKTPVLIQELEKLKKMVEGLG